MTTTTATANTTANTAGFDEVTTLAAPARSDEPSPDLIAIPSGVGTPMAMVARRADRFAAQNAGSR